MAHPRVVLESDQVIFQTDDKTRVFQVNKTRSIFFEKTKLKGQDIVGQPYGTLFEVQQGKLVVVKSENGASASSIAALESGKDNRELVACGENQKLTQEEIMKMKEKGLSGQDIVEKLVEQSETFKTKTEFSQEKYIKKKKKKHMLMFRILHPTSRLLLETFKYAPSKICHLRADSLSQLLGYSNVMWGCTVAVVESCQGLVLGSVLERLGGNGKVVHLYPGNDMNRHSVKSFNFPDDQMNTLLEFPLNKLASLEDGSLQQSAPDQPDENATSTAVSSTSETARAASDKATAVEGSSETARAASDKTTAVDSSSETARAASDKTTAVDGSSETARAASDKTTAVDGSSETARAASDKTTAVDGSSEAVGTVGTAGSDDPVGKSAATPDSKDVAAAAAAMEVDKDSDNEAMEEEGGDGGDGEGKEAKKAARNKGDNQPQKRQRSKQNPAELVAKKQLRAERLQETVTILSEKNLDGLIIATKYDCVSILLRLLPYVAPSRPVVVFSQHKDPLVECFTRVKESGCGIQLKLSESWYREYQVLPSRTHPLMSMSGTGGYLLSFVRVTPQQ